LASTFHSLHAISSQLGAVKGGGGGIREVECGSFVMRCRKTVTGIKFFVVASPQAKDVDGFLKALHELYSDWVLKDPFYELDMPIRVEKFEVKLAALLAEKYPRSAA